MLTFIDHSRHHAAAAEIIAGLAMSPPEVSPRYLYDALGSRLFTALTALPEYYLTRTEQSIFDVHGPQLLPRSAPSEPW